jgi:hypothetical protein
MDVMHEMHGDGGAAHRPSGAGPELGLEAEIGGGRAHRVCVVLARCQRGPHSHQAARSESRKATRPVLLSLTFVSGGTYNPTTDPVTTR